MMRVLMWRHSPSNDARRGRLAYTSSLTAQGFATNTAVF